MDGLASRDNPTQAIRIGERNGTEGGTEAAHFGNRSIVNLFRAMVVSLSA
jgi:hypothetical protein